jgi:branched-subunit amino acid aminotransferase/4-amino-4-deoxychorismate lyase
VIWIEGQVVPDSELTIDALDRTFEHGMGLFETLRTWNGHTPLLERHRARLTQSASTLGLRVDPERLPDESAVRELLRAEEMRGDVGLRITLTGGTSASAYSCIWMRTIPLPKQKGAGYGLGPTFEVTFDDPLLRHKTLNYWRRRIAYDNAVEQGFDEVLSTTADGIIWEGSRTNLFLVVNGGLVTPPMNGPILPGIMRAVVLERARSAAIPVKESHVTHSDFESSNLSELFLTNALRGIIPVLQLGSRSFGAPGPLTMRLWGNVEQWLCGSRD